MFYLYRFINKKGDIIYVGKSKDIRKRLLFHFGTSGHLPEECYNETIKIEVLTLKTKTEMNIKELYYISKYSPKYNSLDKNEPVYYAELEKGDVWKIYDLESETKKSDYHRITKLEKEVLDLKQKLQEQKDNNFKQLQELYKQLEYHYHMEEALDKYQEETGLRWKRKAYGIVLY